MITIYIQNWQKRKKSIFVNFFIFASGATSQLCKYNLNIKKKIIKMMKTVTQLLWLWIFLMDSTRCWLNFLIMITEQSIIESIRPLTICFIHTVQSSKHIFFNMHCAVISEHLVWDEKNLFSGYENANCITFRFKLFDNSDEQFYFYSKATHTHIHTHATHHHYH